MPFSSRPLVPELAVSQEKEGVVGERTRVTQSSSTLSFGCVYLEASEATLDLLLCVGHVSNVYRLMCNFAFSGMF